MKNLKFWNHASIRTKILVPFFLIFVSTTILGTYYSIQGVSQIMRTSLERQLKDFSLMVSEALLHQEQRIVFHAQNMAETKNLADQILNTNQVRILQIHELQSLREESIRFFGVYGMDLPRDDALYPLVQKGLKGLRVTGLVNIPGPQGKALHLLGVAPVPGQEAYREVVVLGTLLNPDFLRGLAGNLGMDLILFDLEGRALAGTVEDLRLVKEAFSRGLQPSSLFENGGSGTTLKTSIDLDGIPYKAIIQPLRINYRHAGAIALIAPVTSYLSARKLFIIQTIIYSLAILVAMTFIYLLIVRGLTNPLKALEGASKKMMEGEAVDEVFSSSADEIGTLARTFNRMSQSLQQREREQRLTLQDFKNRTEELNAILGHMTEGVVVQNQDYVIEYMNDAAVRSFGRRVGEKCYHTFYDREEPCDPCSIEEIIFKKKPLYQYSMQDPEGRYFEIIAQPLHNMDGSTKVITLRRDVTARVRRFETEKRMQNKIQEERLNAIRQVVVSIKHVINNSLTALFGAMEVLENDDAARSANEQELVRLMRTEGEKIEDVVSKLSQISEPVVTEYMDDITMIDIDNSMKQKKNDP